MPDCHSSPSRLCRALRGRGDAGGGISQSVKDKTRWVANAKGAKAKECFLAFDDEGAVVTNATVLGAFGRYNDGEKCFRGTTDTNGCYSIAGVSRDRMWYRISKEGYYSSSGVKSYIDTEEVPAVRNGCWQPYGERHSVVLKKIRNPTALIRSPAQKYFSYPPSGSWVGFDLEVLDWVSPMGKGTHSDVLIRFTDEKSSSAFARTMEVSFTNNLYAGAYEMKCDSHSELKTIYSASPDEKYLESFTYRYKRDSTGYHGEELDDGKYLVVRTRTKIDDNGNLLSAHYGIIFGNWRFVEKGGMFVERLIFNPQPNDTNLEDAGTYYLNPCNLDRNLEWNNQNLCEDPLYPRPEKRRRMEYESFNRDQKP